MSFPEEKKSFQSIICLIPSIDPLAITALKPYTLYAVRLAALNAAGLGQFSDPNSVRTQGIRKCDINFQNTGTKH